MSQLHHLQNLKCQLNILKLKNLDAYDFPNRELFIRSYVSLGDGRRISIDTQLLPSMITLELEGTLKPMSQFLDKHSISFELRWRRPKGMFKCLTKSKLIGRVEVAWKDIVSCNGKEMVEWISFVTTSPVPLDVKPPALLVKMEIDAQVSEAIERTRHHRAIEEHECSCRDCQWIGSEEYTFLAATAAVDAF